MSVIEGMTSESGRERPGEPDGVFRHRFCVPREAIDGNGHVNNVVYVQWMQEVAIRHAGACGGTADGAVIAKGETEWVLISEAYGRPCAIPQSLSKAFASWAG
jgi:acyl-CoA thioesterase FadM